VKLRRTNSQALLVSVPRIQGQTIWSSRQKLQPVLVLLFAVTCDLGLSFGGGTYGLGLGLCGLDLALTYVNIVLSVTLETNPSRQCTA